jgi:predicted anti-sigma-YlaC factor YlaD
MKCSTVEELLSDCLENTISVDNRLLVDAHLQSCPACSDLLADMSEIIAWGKSFPVYEAPSWLAARIVANTPRVSRESWLDTLTAVGKWLVEPRTAMAAFTATLVLGWMGSMAGISPDMVRNVRTPSAIYYGAHSALNRAYDEAVRKYYRSPLVSEIRTRIEQLREIS